MNRRAAAAVENVLARTIFLFTGDPMTAIDFFAFIVSFHVMSPFP